MTQQVSFKERVKESAIKNASAFYNNYVKYEYLVISKAFDNTGYYVIKAHEGNYLHLVGVNTAMPASSFFKKCLNATLIEDDFNFTKAGVGKNVLKGAVREKIRVLQNMVSMFSGDNILVQANFKKNQIVCAFASTDGICTLGFSKSGHPKSLLRGDYLDLTNRYDVDAIIRRDRDSELFDTLVLKNDVDYSYVNQSIKDILSDEMEDIFFNSNKSVN